LSVHTTAEFLSAVRRADLQCMTLYVTVINVDFCNYSTVTFIILPAYSWDLCICAIIGIYLLVVDW